MLQLILRLLQAILRFFKRLFSSPVSSPVLSSIRIVSPAANVSGSVVIIEYEIINANRVSTDINVRYAVAGGTPRPAHAASSHPQHEGSSNLSSSATGI